MRHVHLIIINVLAAATVIFSAQNLQLVHVSFLRLSMEVRLAFLIVGIYVLGALTGASLMALLRKIFKGMRLGEAL